MWKVVFISVITKVSAGVDVENVSVVPLELYGSERWCDMERSTGGSCMIWGCDASRHATCVSWSCKCALGDVAVDGSCVPCTPRLNAYAHHEYEEQQRQARIAAERRREEAAEEARREEERRQQEMMIRRRRRRRVYESPRRRANGAYSSPRRRTYSSPRRRTYVAPAPAPPQGWSMALRCPMAFNTGSVGSCKFSSCSPSRGPTHCSFGSCYCNHGYCRYPHSTLHVQARYCVARIPGKSCHASRFCWTGGMTRSFCESGLCMCKWGYHWDGKTCGVGETSLSAVAMTAEDIEIEAHSTRMVKLNVLIAGLWASVAAAIAGAAVFIALRRNARKVHMHGSNELLLG